MTTTQKLPFAASSMADYVTKRNPELVQELNKDKFHVPASLPGIIKAARNYNAARPSPGWVKTETKIQKFKNTALNYLVHSGELPASNPGVDDLKNYNYAVRIGETFLKSS